MLKANRFVFVDIPNGFHPLVPPSIVSSDYFSIRVCGICLAMNLFLVLCFLLVSISVASSAQSLKTTWTCKERRCIKEHSASEMMGIAECKAKCLPFGGLWPRPNGPSRVGTGTSQVDTLKINFEKHEYPENIESLLEKAEKRFLARVRDPAIPVGFVDVLHTVEIKLEIYDPSVGVFSTGTDESYKLVVFPPNSGKGVRAEIEANTFFGLRHGLETLSQLFFYDDVMNVHKILHDVFIEDKPEFTHRGIVLDTARSYISVANIMKLLDAMAMNKLNTFHWHITDSQSFPYVSESYPELSETGAYSKSQVYTQEDIKRIVREARSLGIRIVPELDAPAHVGEGWSALGQDLITCFKWQPWRDFCVEPPCGQLNPTNDRVYEVLGTLYQEYVHLFGSDLFHMGGDEVNINCWKSTPAIRDWMKKMNYSNTSEDYHRLWGEYQVKALTELKKTKTDPNPQAVVWTSSLTQPDYIDRFLNPDDYVVQIWTLKTDSMIKWLVEKKFRVIFSNYDELYFDCGGPSWVGHRGHNWCAPYIGWQDVYLHSPHKILENQGIEVNEEVKKLVLGSESALWTEQLDGHSIHVRLWPRTAALAERLWSDPKDDWTDAQFRMNHHRERMGKVVPVELLQPEWCYQNDGFCD